MNRAVFAAVCAPGSAMAATEAYKGQVELMAVYARRDRTRRSAVERRP
jgi:hypothetical protein